jgi:hypothetical protein
MLTRGVASENPVLTTDGYRLKNFGLAPAAHGS